jgi:hypothetical protein
MTTTDAADVTTVQQILPAVHAERWQQWQRRNAKDNRRAETRVRIAFGVVLVCVAAWLVLQLL